MGFLATAQMIAFEQYMKGMEFLGADGANTINFGNRILNACIAVVSALGGGWLVVVAIKGLVVALKGDNKDWGKAGLAIVTGIVGGLLIAVAVASSWRAFFQRTGSDFNIISG